MNFFKQYPSISLALAMGIVGSFVVVNKMLTERFPIFLASELRLLLGAIILSSLLLVKEGRFPRLSRKDFFVIFTQSFVGVFLFSMFLLMGLKYTTAMESGIITSITPAIIGIMSLVIFKERLSRYQISGILFALSGALLINIAGVLTSTSFSLSLLGNSLVLLAVVAEAVFITFGKLISKDISPLASATLTSSIGAVLFLPFAIYQSLNYDFGSTSLTTWGLIMYTGIVVTVIAVILLNQAMSQLSAGNSAVFSALMPMSAVVLSFLVLKEPILWYHGIGFLCVLAGIIMISLQRGNRSSAQVTTPMS